MSETQLDKQWYGGWSEGGIEEGEPGSWVYRVPKSTQQFVDRVREHLRLVVVFYNFLKTFQDYSWHFFMWKRLVCQATGETVELSQISKQSARYKTKSNRWKWNTYLQYASTMENSAGNVREYLSGIDIERHRAGRKQTNASGGVRECEWVFIIYVCFMPSDINHARLIERAQCPTSFVYQQPQLQAVFHWNWQMAKVGCTSQFYQGVNFAVTL